MNMKSLHTQQQIEKAMFSLLQKKPYVEISIAEITRKAKVDINEHKLKSLTEQLTAYLTFFKNNPEIMKTLLDAGFEGSLLNFQTRYLKKLLEVYHPDLHLPDYAVAYQSGGIYMLLVWWVKQNYSTPLEELITYAEKHIML